MFKNNLSKLIVVIVVVIVISIGGLVLYRATQKSLSSKEKSGEITAISDVDAHSQSQMKITVKCDSVIAIKGDLQGPRGQRRV